MNTKSTLFLLPALALSLPNVYGQAARNPHAVPTSAAVQETDLAPTDIRTERSYYDESHTVHITFPAPMVAPEEVGKPVSPSLLQWSEPLEHKAVWTSTSAVTVTLKAIGGEQRVIHLQTAPGLKTLAGQAVTRAETYLPSRGPIWINNRYSHDYGQAFLFSAQEESGDAALAAAVPHAFYRVTTGSVADGNTEIVPAEVRPAVVADALKNWDEYVSATGWAVDETDKEAFLKMDGNTPLPHIWMADTSRLRLTPNQHADLVLPKLGLLNDETHDYDDQTLGSVRIPSFEYMVENKRVGEGMYDVSISFNLPMAAQDAEALMHQLPWQVLTMGHNQQPRDMELNAEGKYAASTGFSTVTLEPLTAETEAAKETVTLSDGTKATGYKKLCFRAHVTGDRVRLSVNTPFTSVYGSSIDAKALKYYSNLNLDYTVLAPRSPFIYSDMLNNGMQADGNCTLRCRYRSLEKMQVRVYRVNAGSPQAALLLGEYLKHYTPATDNKRFFPWRENDAKETALAPEIPAMITHEEKTVELPAGEGTQDIDLAKLFGDSAEMRGMYFVDARGTTHAEWQKDGQVSNQGLVQVTNLGLMWKLSGRHMFAYAYHLSDGREVSSATLRMLDSMGKVLGEAKVVNGIAEAPLPEGTAFMQISEGNDHYTAPATARDCDISVDHGLYSETPLVAPELLPRGNVFLFTDRNLYRPGDTVHLKGIMRFITGNELSIAKLSSVKVTVDTEGAGEPETYTVKPEADGSFTLDFPVKNAGSCYVNVDCDVEGDDDATSPDMAMLLAAGAPKDDMPYSVNSGRSAGISLIVSDFRRNAFEVKAAMDIQADKHSISVSTDAVNFTEAPVSYGRVEWRLLTSTTNFYPENFPSYYFGDYRDPQARDIYYNVYYGALDDAPMREDIISMEGALDEKGHGIGTFCLKESDYPMPTPITLTASVTDGNEQTIKDVVRSLWHPCSVYAGISCEGAFSRKGEPMKLKTILVDTKGNAYDGAPLKGKITVRRKMVHAYRYGAKARTNVHNSVEWQTLLQKDVQLSGTPGIVEVPTESAGVYEIDITGTDAQGKPFRTTVCQHVWGDEESPWEVGDDTYLEMISSNDVYRPGETAKVLVKTPVDGEVLFTMERGNVLRHFRRKVTVQNPVVEIPVTEEDAPMVYLSAFLVQTGENNRVSNGKPVQKLGQCTLHVLPVKNKLTVEMETPTATQRPGEDSTVGGVVRDADGKPVANASVTLFAEDEGVLQIMGYHLPDPLAHFMSHREHGVVSYSSLSQLLGEDLAKRSFGNKGVFIGGGDDDESEDSSPVREDFAPCALWLSSVKTDAQGRFSATFKNPDTLTRYRVMAVTTAGSDRFGNGMGSYIVDTPVRVEPSAPLSATDGDVLDLPATVSMSVKDIPAAAEGKELKWTLNMSGTQNATLPKTATDVILKGASPKTVILPVTLNGTGDCKLTWRIQGTGEQANLSDAAAYSFTVRPPMPFLREAVSGVLEPGKSGKLSQWLKTDFAKQTETELTFTTSPFAGAAAGMKYLITYPHGCVEQLSSTLLPWLFKQEFEQAVGLRYPEGTDSNALIAKTLRKIMDRQMGNGLFTYWETGNPNRNFSPYVGIVLLASGTEWPGRDSCVSIIREELLEEAEANLTGLYFLAEAGALDSETFRKVVALRKNPAEADCWMLALCAQKIGLTADSDTWMKKARKLKNSGKFAYGMPQAEALESLWALEKSPSGSATAKQLRSYVEKMALTTPTTWDSGWMCLILHKYIQKNRLEDKKAVVNGHEVSMSSPWHTTVKLGDAVSYTATGATVYVNAVVEGYQSKKQKEQMVDKGFAVTRRYERLTPEGTWTPTGTFRVGDVVRVTLTAKHTDKLPAVYTVVEDRLPAAFEAVNPALTTQGLPDDVATNTANWSGSTFINNREYLKDCVRIYATRWGNGDLTATYIARVVKSGRVTAPAAKAELMYRPQIYGLSVPQHFVVQPR